MFKYIVGVDLGKKGGIAIIPLKRPYKPRLYDMPFQNGVIDLTYLDSIIDKKRSFVVIERVHPFGKSSAQSNWHLGCFWGIFYTYCTLNTIPFSYVLPAVWKKHFNLLGKTKKDSIFLVEKLGVSNVRTKRGGFLDGRAEAFLVGLWALQTKVYKEYESRAV